MKPENSKEVAHAYRKFVWLLFLTIVFSVLAFGALIKTALVDDAKIQVKKAEYDKVTNNIYKLADIVDNIGGKLKEIKMNQDMDAATEVNNTNLMKSINGEQIEMRKIMDSMKNEYCLLYRKMYDDIYNITKGIDNYQKNIKETTRVQSQIDDCNRTIRRR